MSESDQVTFSDWLKVLTLAQEAHQAAAQANWERFLELEDSMCKLCWLPSDSLSSLPIWTKLAAAFTELVKRVIALHQETVQWAEAHRNTLATEVGHG